MHSTSFLTYSLPICTPAKMTEHFPYVGEVAVLCWERQHQFIREHEWQYFFYLLQSLVDISTLLTDQINQKCNERASNKTVNSRLFCHFLTATTPRLIKRPVYKKNLISLLLGALTPLLPLQKRIAWEQSSLNAISEPCNETEMDGGKKLEQTLT